MIDFRQLNDFKYSYLTSIILFGINHFPYTDKYFQDLQFNMSNSIYQICLRKLNNLHLAVLFQKTTSNNNP